MTDRPEETSEQVIEPEAPETASRWNGNSDLQNRRLITPKLATVVLVGSFVFGALLGGFVYQESKPRFHQLAANNAIRKDVCERIAADLQDFKKAPHAFQRTALKILLGEAEAVVTAKYSDVLTEASFDFRDSPETLVADCQADARQWVNIPSRFPEYYDSERALVQLEAKKPLWSRLPTQPSPPPFATEQQPEGRIALVIGNAAYRSAPLRNPSNDAEDMAEFLKKANFSVTKVTDADLVRLREIVAQFLKELPKYDVGLIYYSGHGIEFRGRNYLLPVDAVIQQEEEIPRLAVDATQIADTASRTKVGTLILILDACRNAPIFASTRSVDVGLVEMLPPRGSIIAFSAGPGQIAADGTARNSPYTEALLQQMQIPNRKIEDILKETGKVVSVSTQNRQVPWYNSSLIGDFYMLIEKGPGP